MEPTGSDNVMSLVSARKTLLSRMPLTVSSHEVVDIQRPSFNEGLQHFHAEEYQKAIKSFHVSNEMQENNLILFAMSLTYYLLADYGNARIYADRIDAAYFGPGLIPEMADVENLYLLIDAEAAGWEEQEDAYRRSDNPPMLYMPPDLLQFKDHYLTQASNNSIPAHEQDK